MSEREEIIFWAGDRILSHFRNPEASRIEDLVSCGIEALKNLPEG
ncbi:hypothetical protein CLV88_11887 [Shimia abyssi]|uniref:Uncharacterized protein n=1 Tax=Shimia abyssi TaxID=1662395 RepID=A0A2P8F6U0_9RHOB|nr:hypothetical protein CLV88_11887 [Shimia abyssi]